jgi:hypothetical protein
MSPRFPTIMALVVGLAFVLAPAAPASELIARAATNVRLEVTADGTKALLSYRANRRTWYVLASGAINAIPPTAGRKQVSFRLRRSTSRPAFKAGCRHVHAMIPRLVVACGAGGSSWAVQSWQRALPNFGAEPNAFRARPELRLSHWSGPLAVLTLKADWSYGSRWQHVYGSLTYRSRAVYGFGSTRSGVPSDSFGRIVYLDTFGSVYGRGWHRENSFLTHNPWGNFCYDLSPHRARLTGAGLAYRATVSGPGVTPDVGAYVASPGPFSAERDSAANQEQAIIAHGDRLCRPS